MRPALSGTERAILEMPEWRIGSETASMDTGMRYADGREGRLRASLVWRDERWLVSNVAMERDW